MKKTDVIQTNSGKLQGYIEDGLEIFKGIPYAEPPIGALRFKAPIDKNSWEGVLEAMKYGPCAWQGYTELERWLGKPKPENEDCLCLNIWTPATDDDKKRPVMFWIHGGAFVMGTGNDPTYDGSTLAKRGDVVVVTMNYRLGLFGFAYLPGVTANAGSLDQIKALEWVRDNIAHFGGDPDNITIFGESAGAYSVIALCTMPAAKGLFRRVIAESAPAIDTVVSDKTTKKVLRKLRIKGGDIEAARNIPSDQIIEAQNKVFAANPTDVMALRPLIEGDIWPKHPLKGFEDGDCADIDIMIGTNFEEFKLFAAMNVFKRMIEADVSMILMGYLGMAGITAERADDLLQAYKDAREGIYPTDPFELFNAIVTDFVFRIPSIRLLEAQSPHRQNCYSYLFNWKTPALGGIFGACHALEMPFVFGTIDAPTLREFVKGAPKQLSENMMDAWIAFARTGNPNHDNIPEWPAYNVQQRATMVFAEECHIENAPLDQERKAWDGLLEL